MEQKTVGIIGAGVGGLGLACLLAKKGYKVTVFEKNEMAGGRARVFEEKGFVFDMGPSWYMMPEVFEHFFGLLGEKVEEHYSLKRLAPSYRLFFKDEQKPVDIYSDTEKNVKTFDEIEPGSGEKLKEFLDKTKYQYDIAYNEFMFKNYDKLGDFLTPRMFEVGRKLPLLKSQKNIVNKIFKSEVLRRIMQYQTLLVGTAPKETPGIYTLMNYVDLVEGEWYPDGGMGKIPSALVKVAEKHGVKFVFNTDVSSIDIKDDVAKSVTLVSSETIPFDIVVSNSDVAHTDMKLLDNKYQQKSFGYWDRRRLAPSAFILYLGIDGQIPTLTHHNLLSALDWDKNFDQLTTAPEWPKDPSFYVCAPSKSDTNVAPPNTENLFVLVPIAPGLKYDEAFVDSYTGMVFDHLEKYLGVENIKDRVLYKRAYCVNDFIKDYHAFKGTALGLAHTLGQTALFRPNNVHKKVKNLFYVGAGTNPGIGVPICLISAELAYKRIEGIKTDSPLEGVI